VRDDVLADVVASGGLVLEASAVVGHGHGGGGHGGHGHHHGGPSFYGWGGWGGDWGGYDWSEPVVVLACGPGQVRLADGRCVDASQLGMGVASPSVQVGAPVTMAIEPQWASGEPIHVEVAEDGTIALPDGSTASADALDYTGLMAAVDQRIAQAMHEHNVTMHGASAGAVLGPGGSGTPLGQGSSATGTQPTGSGNDEADAINAEMQAIDQVLSGGALGPNPILPGTYSPSLTSTAWTDDKQAWSAYYADIGSFSWLDLTNDLQGWQAEANAWGSYIRAQAPNASLPPNFPTGSAGLASLVPAGLGSALQWGVIAVLVGVGVWMLWPVLVGSHGLLAGLFG